MSRLYGWIFSDMRKTELTVRGNKEVSMQINYGSKSNSKPLVRLTVTYPKGKEKPEIKVWEN